MRPLDGIRVLDLTHVLAGPFCTYQLAVLGADVIKIEAPDRPDMMRVEGVRPDLNARLYGTNFQSQNGGKRAITLDLTKPGGADVLRDLIASADVLVQNFAGDGLTRLGFGADDCTALNPRLIYCQMTGFGRTGPKADHTAYDTVIQAYSGLMSLNVRHPDGAQRVGPPVVDYGTGAQAALAIVAAVLQRERTGQGQVIDVSMLDSALMLMSALVTDCLASGIQPGVYGNANPSYAGYRTFDTAEGLLMIGAFTNEQLARLLDHLGETERAAEVRATPRTEIAARAVEDADLLQRHFLTRTAAEWEASLAPDDIAAARVRPLTEALADAQVAARPVLQASHDDGRGPDRLPVAGYAYAHDGPALDRPPPEMGEHTDEVLGELGLDAARIAELRANGAIA